jgi:hypothetical protein
VRAFKLIAPESRSQASVIHGGVKVLQWPSQTALAAYAHFSYMVSVAC